MFQSTNKSIINYKQHFIKKPADRQSYLHANSEHRRSLKENIPYSQALRVKRICSINSEFEAHINTIKDQFVKRGYEKTLIENQIESCKIRQKCSSYRTMEK